MKQEKNNKFWFILGNFPLISASEIEAVFGLTDAKVAYEPPILIADLSDFEPDVAIKRLAGTIKIGQEISGNLTEEELVDRVVDELRIINGKIIFGLSYYGAAGRGDAAFFVGSLGKRIKQALKERGASVRHVFNREAVLSSVTVSKNSLDTKGREFLIVKQGNKFSLAQTLAVQPFEEWGGRDFGRPGRDDLSGMLPPKLARMMINLSGADMNSTLLDPFCGSGTIINEAALIGYKKIIGSDISEKAIEDSKKNFEWLKEKNIIQSSPEARFIHSSISDLLSHISGNEIDVIVAEPYLGKPLKGNESEQFLRAQIEELKKLYLETFSVFKELLKKGGTIIFIIPCFKSRNNWLRVDCSSEIKKLGFIAEPFFQNNGFLLYARPDQKVGREIWRFKLV